jgi:hypothetical protein
MSEAVVKKRKSKFIEDFPTSKVLVCMGPRNLSNSDTLVRNVEDSFLSSFNYTAEQLPLPLKHLFGSATSRLAIHDIHSAILKGRQTFHDIILYNSSGEGLSCHVSVTSIMGNRPKIFVTDEATSMEDCREKYAVLTIRSSKDMEAIKGSGSKNVEVISQEDDSGVNNRSLKIRKVGN